MTSRTDLALFLKTPENAQKLSSLVEDIRCAMMDYQVRSPKSLALTAANVCSDFFTVGHLQRGLSTDRESHSLSAPPFVVTSK